MTKKKLVYGPLAYSSVGYCILYLAYVGLTKMRFEMLFETVLKQLSSYEDCVEIHSLATHAKVGVYGKARMDR